MRLKPKSTKEIVYIGIASLLPVIGQIIIATRPTLSVGAKVRGSLYAFLLTFVWLMLIPVEDSAKQAESAVTVEDSPVADIETVEELPSFTQMASCGNVSEDADFLYPVFLDNVDLDKARLQFCGDAISSVRQGTGKKTVILASFGTLKEAQKFADQVGGEVGEPDLVAKETESVPPAEPSREIVEEREQPLLEEERKQPTKWQPPAESQLVETDDSVPVGIKWDMNVRCDSWDDACVSIKVVPSEDCEYLGAQLVFYDKSGVRLGDAFDYESNVSANEAVWLSFGALEAQLPIIEDYKLAEFECR